ncbi:hypothetical protein WMF04_03945 [Sorangium sp. So ce260]|uniref:hypothetical protein n=1 Tax=Sorangium sp. So ce260 TaxID=3133291 RepID=UPI003F5DDAB0
MGLIARHVGTNATVDWDRDAGEDWGRVLAGDEVVAYVWTRAPFVVLTEALQAVSGELESMRIKTLVVPDMQEKCLTTNREIVDAWAGHATSEVLSLTSFSADDLWWATV